MAIVPLSNSARADGLYDYDLSEIGKHVFREEKGQKAARSFCERLRDGSNEGSIYLFRFPKLLGVLAELQPTAFLDVFLGGSPEVSSRIFRFLNRDLERKENPLSLICDQVVLDWCSEQPVPRYQNFCREAVLYQREDKSASYQWKPLFFELVKAAPDQGEVLKSIGQNINPRSWSGPLHTVLERRSVLFSELLEHEDLVLRNWAGETLDWLRKWIEAERRRDESERKERDESFE